MKVIQILGFKLSEYPVPEAVLNVKVAKQPTSSTLCEKSFTSKWYSLRLISVKQLSGGHLSTLCQFNQYFAFRQLIDLRN